MKTALMLVWLLLFSQKEKYHTHLAVLYLSDVLHLKSLGAEKQEKLTKTQTKLRSLLQRSDLYRVHFILGKTLQTTVYLSQAREMYSFQGLNYCI